MGLKSPFDEPQSTTPPAAVTSNFEIGAVVFVMPMPGSMKTENSLFPKRFCHRFLPSVPL